MGPYIPRIKSTRSHLLVIERELTEKEIKTLKAIAITNTDYIYTFEGKDELGDTYCFIIDSLEDEETSFTAFKIENNKMVY